MPAGNSSGCRLQAVHLQKQGWSSYHLQLPSKFPGMSDCQPDKIILPLRIICRQRKFRIYFANNLERGQYVTRHYILALFPSKDKSIPKFILNLQSIILLSSYSPILLLLQLFMHKHRCRKSYKHSSEQFLTYHILLYVHHSKHRL